MDENIMLRINEDGTAEPYEPYTTVACETKEDYDRLVELVELGKSIVRCKDCKHGEIDDPDFPNQYYCRSGFLWNAGDFFCKDGERRVDNG